MITILAVAAFMLVVAGVFLVLQRSLFRVVLGFSLLAHAVNLMVLASAGPPAGPAILTAVQDHAPVTDPLPQALVLTAIVISLAVTLYLLMLLATRGRTGVSGFLDSPPSDDRGRNPARVKAELRGEEGI